MRTILLGLSKEMSLKLWLGLSSLGVMGMVPLAYNFVNSSSSSSSSSNTVPSAQAGGTTTPKHSCKTTGWEDFLL